MSLGQGTRRASDLIHHVKTQFGDLAGVQITDADILRWINDAALELSAKIRYIKGEATSNAVVGQASYPLPAANAIQIESIHYDGRKLRGISFAQAEAEIFEVDDHADNPGKPQVWWEWAGQVKLWPVPQEAGTLTVYYTRAPDLLTTNSEFLPVPDKHYETLVAFVLSRAYELDEQFDAAQIQYTKFLTKAGETVDEELSGQTMTYPSITIVED